MICEHVQMKFPVKRVLFKGILFLLFIFLSFFTLSFLAGCNGKNGRLKKIDIVIDGKTFHVEVARTEEERQRGLMFRKSLKEDEGMLFVFTSDQHLSFWMKNTSIPLSIAFISSEGKILQIEDMDPFSERVIRSEHSVRYALELNRGMFKKIGAGVGSIVRFPENFF